MVYSAPFDDVERQAPSPGEALGFTANGAIEAGQVVTLTGDQTVGASTTDGEAVIGVATQSVADGDEVMVVGGSGRVLVTGGASGISAGDPLTSYGGTGDDGTVNTASTTGDYVLGYALESGGAGDTLVAVVDRGGQLN